MNGSKIVSVILVIVFVLLIAREVVELGWDYLMVLEGKSSELKYKGVLGGVSTGVAAYERHLTRAGLFTLVILWNLLSLLREIREENREKDINPRKRLSDLR